MTCDMQFMVGSGVLPAAFTFHADRSWQRNGGDDGHDIYKHDLLYIQAYQHFGFADIVSYIYSLDYDRQSAKQNNSGILYLLHYMAILICESWDPKLEIKL